MAKRSWLSGYGRGRSQLYGLARLMGDLRPFLEANPQKIARRVLNKGIGRHLGRGAFGGGGWGEIAMGSALLFLKGLFGLNRR